MNVTWVGIQIPWFVYSLSFVVQRGGGHLREALSCHLACSLPAMSKHTYFTTGSRTFVQELTGNQSLALSNNMVFDRQNCNKGAHQRRGRAAIHAPLAHYGSGSTRPLLHDPCQHPMTVHDGNKVLGLCRFFRGAGKVCLWQRRRQCDSLGPLRFSAAPPQNKTNIRTFNTDPW